MEPIEFVALSLLILAAPVGWLIGWLIVKQTTRKR